MVKTRQGLAWSSVTIFRGIRMFAHMLLASLTVLISFLGVRGSVFSLERGFPMSHPIRLSELQARDSARHAHLFGGVVNVSLVHEKYYPHAFGMYLLKIKLGSPPREFYVLFDTGSDLFWVPCRNCNVCPAYTDLGVPYHLYDYANSSTAGLVPCSAPVCNDKCSHQTNHCNYNISYAGGDYTAGYYVSNELHLDMIPRQPHTKLHSSVSVIFGCTTYVTGSLASTLSSPNGIFGFGQGAMSVISQLSSQGTTPSVFAHCLKGDNSGGSSILILGEVLGPNIMYTPLVQTGNSHYSINLQSIAVNGKILPVDPRAFEETVVDSGTVLARLAEEAYNPFVAAVTLAARKSAAPQFANRTQCYLISNSTVAEAFPRISLHFDAGALMVLEPHEYLVPTEYDEDMWCIGFTKAEGTTKGLTILGDLVLQDKIVVYDLGRQRVGWAKYNCSMHVNVSVTAPSGSHVSKGSSSEDMLQHKLLIYGIVGLLMLVTLCVFLAFFVNMEQ